MTSKTCTGPALMLALAPAGTQSFVLHLRDPAGADAWGTRTAVDNAMQGHILGKAVYVGLFRRPPQRPQ